MFDYHVFPSLFSWKASNTWYSEGPENTILMEQFLALIETVSTTTFLTDVVNS